MLLKNAIYDCGVVVGDGSDHGRDNRADEGNDSDCTHEDGKDNIEDAYGSGYDCVVGNEVEIMVGGRMTWVVQPLSCTYNYQSNVTNADSLMIKKR